MKVENFIKIVNSDFYTGVPDSQLKDLCDYLMNTYGIDPYHHIIAANEGNCTAIAAGYHLATGKIPVVYMQNSGEGNAVNPVVSLLSRDIYAIPVILIIGWRGEPGIHDEPQHIHQGKITIKLLELMGIESFVVSENTKELEITRAMTVFRKKLGQGQSVAFIITKGAFEYQQKIEYKNSYTMSREEIIQEILTVSGSDPIVSTTGKTSRELFELRENRDELHIQDFLTVGSMGHCSSIALGVAINKPEATVWCIDGDGAVLMHMGAMALIGSISPQNLIHIVINNESHETVGGMPTVADHIDLIKIAKSCGYPLAISVENMYDLKMALLEAKKQRHLVFIEVKAKIGARSDLGRPTISTLENKKNFMDYLRKV